ncbi:uncharacterized protein EDB93DRAFT_1095871, partial [Suillus bovinus]|uniref:uncharacterized protein n=1 Tax=Suillus bovinus TaxID=48563 RepID=UPI001B85FC2C
DHYGLFQTYPNSFPLYNPDEITSLAHLSDSTHFASAQQPAAGRPWWSGFGTSMKTPTENFFVPFLNATIYRLMCWFHGGSTMKSLTELDRLVNKVILAEDFDKADLQGFQASKELEHLDNYQGDPEDICSSFSTAGGWIETSVKIRLPADGVEHPSEECAPEFNVPGLFYRRPLEVLKTAFREASAEQFHLTPFETSFQASPNEPAEHVYSELYMSPAMINEHHKIASTPRVDGCTLETVVASIMLWSDSTHLASFAPHCCGPYICILGISQNMFGASHRASLCTILPIFLK